MKSKAKQSGLMLTAGVALLMYSLPAAVWAQSTGHGTPADPFSFQLPLALLMQSTESDEQGGTGSSESDAQAGTDSSESGAPAAGSLSLRSGHPHEGLTADQINKKLNNPLGDVASLQFEFQWRSYKGDLPGSKSQDSVTFQFQPVFPIPLDDEGHVVIVRPTFDFKWKPNFNPGNAPFGGDGGFDEDLGLADTALITLYGHTDKKTGFGWGVGPTFILPTHTDDALGKDQFRMGPAGFVLLERKWGTIALFGQHWWNIGGTNDPETNLTALQYVYWFSLGDGWQIGGAPTATYDWGYADSDDAWTVPINLGVQKTTKIGKMPLQVRCEFTYNIVRPDSFGPHYGINLRFTPVVPSPFHNLFSKK